MKEKLIRKGYHLMGILDGMAICYVILLTIGVCASKPKNNKPLSEQLKERRESKEIH